MNLARTDVDLYSRAVEAARAELRSISDEYERLAQRKARLEAFIANGEPLIPEGAPHPQPVVPTTSHAAVQPTPREKMPVWKAIELSINGKGDDFTVADALMALGRIGRPVTSENRHQIVRAELERRADVFRKISPGRYRVIAKEERL